MLINKIKYKYYDNLFDKYFDQGNAKEIDKLFRIFPKYFT